MPLHRHASGAVGMAINPYSAIPFTSSLLAFVLGWVSYLHHPSSRIHQRFFLLCMSVFFWPLSLGVMLNLRDPDSVILWTKIGHTTCTLAPAVLVDFVIVLTGKDRLRWVARLYYLFSCCFLVLMWTTSSYFSGTVHSYPWGMYAAAGPLVTLDALAATTAVLWTWPVLLRAVRGARRSAIPQQYNQLRYFQLALFLFSFALLDYLPKYGIGILPMGSFFIAAFAAVVTYAIVRHQLLDIRIAVRRTVLYSVLAGTITAVYFGVVLATERILQGVMGYRSIAGSLIAGFVIAICFNPLKQFLQQLLDRVFFHGTQASLAEENERLRQELTRSEKLKAVATLAAGMAHEIKNPLASIKTFAEYLPQKYDDPAYREKFARIMSQEVDKMNALVQRLLEFARPTEPRLQPVRLSHLLKETLDFLHGTLLQKQIQVETSLVESDEVLADTGQLKQVFLNLLLNSVEAIEPPGRITVSSAQKNGHLDVMVTDTGRGIAHKDLQHVFDPFFTTKTGGTGLGLSVVHSIIREHGGRVTIHSELGRGTKVQVRLPLNGGTNGTHAHSHCR